MKTDTFMALDRMHKASVHLGDRFDVLMTREEAQANLDARAILFNCSNAIFMELGCPISKEEVEGAAIIERESSQ